LRALIRTGREHGLELRVAEATVQANDEPVNDMFKHLESALGTLSGKTIAVWGLAFKPKTDDVREAPALRLIQKVVAAGGRVRASDPRALETAGERLAQLGLTDKAVLFADHYEAARGADALVLATEWSQYRSPDMTRLRERLKGRHVFDGRNILIAAEIEEAGLIYRGVGRRGTRN
jgi:UDPglucose 6-dehydrogenase